MPHKPKAVMFDLDGTLATRVTDRSPYEWDRVGEDAPVSPVVTAFKIYSEAGYHMIVVSGRDEKCYKQTASWLLHNVPVVWDIILMRPVGDKRPDDIVKRELYEKYIQDHYDVEAVFDDRNKVVAMWRELGLTCFQVAPGDF